MISVAVSLEHRGRSYKVVKAWKRGEKEEPVNTNYSIKIFDMKEKRKEGLQIKGDIFEGLFYYLFLSIFTTSENWTWLYVDGKELLVCLEEKFADTGKKLIID